MEQNSVDAKLVQLLATLRGWLTRIEKRSRAESAQQCVYEMTRHAPCCDEDAYQKLQV